MPLKSRYFAIMNSWSQLILILFSFLPALSPAQTITLSPAPFEDYSFDHLKIIGQDAQGFFMLQSNLPLELDRDRVGFKNRKYKVAYYKNNLARAWSNLVEPSPSGASVEAVAFANGKVVVASTLYNKGDDALGLYARWINNQGVEVRNQLVGTIKQTGQADKPMLAISGNQLLLALFVLENSGSESQTLHFLLTDSTLNVLKQKSLSIPYGEKSYSVEELSVSNNGDLHVLGVRSRKNQGNGRKREEDFVLFSSPLEVDSLREFVVGSGNKDVTSASLAFDNLNNRLVCAGFYAEKNSTTGAGVMLAMLDMNNPQSLEIVSSPIDNQTQLKILGERNRSHDIGLINYPIRQIILRNDGGAVILAEAFFANDYSYYDYFTQSYTRSIEYHFNNIVTVSVNANGSIHWLNVIRKNQVSTDDAGSFSSYCPVLTEKEFILLYNSDVSRSSDIKTARISASGKQNESSNIRTSNNLLLYSRSGKQVSATEAIVPCISKKKLMLARITF